VAEHIAHAQARGGRYLPDALLEALGGVVDSPQVSALRLETMDGEVLFDGGACDGAGVSPFAPEGCRCARMLSKLGVHPLNGPVPAHGMRGRGWGPGGGQGGGPGWEPLPAGPYRLTLCLDTAEARAALAGVRARAGLLGAGMLLACWLAIALRGAARRQHGLRGRLALAEARAEHQARLAELGAGLAHETKNPLAVVRGLAQALGDAPGADAETRARARVIVDETDSIVAQVNGFLLFARPQAPAPEAVGLAGLAGGLAELLRDEAAAQGVSLETDIPAELRVRADPALLRRALMNLMINALRAMPDGGALRVEASAAGGRAALRVRDTGCGISPEDLPRVGTPYFSRFPGGCGLGLALVRETAAAHGWRLDIAPAPDRGAIVSLEDLEAVADG
jgi:signal transduction histidine kinase